MRTDRGLVREATLLSNIGLGDVALSQGPDVSNGRLAEESTVFAAELAHTFVADLIRSACSIETVHQHSLARGLEPQLFLILQRAHCGKRAELMMEVGNAHPCGRCEVFHMQRLGKVGSQPRNSSCCSLTQIATRRDGAQPFRLRRLKDAVHDFTLNQVAEERNVLRRLKKLKQPATCAQQSEGRFTHREPLTV